MPDRDEWTRLMDEATVPEAAEAHTYHRTFPTHSRAALLECGRNELYVVKGPKAGRAVFNDQVLGKIGRVIGAPVAEVGLVEVPKDLIDSQPELSHYKPEVWHGSRWIPDCTDVNKGSMQHISANRKRFARLAIFYGLAEASDHQPIYEKQPPHDVHSVDHGHFLPGGPGWTKTGLRSAGKPSADPRIVNDCQLTEDELREAARGLHALTNEEIARIVAEAPEHWGVSVAERAALCHYLAERRDALMKEHTAPDEEGES